MANRSVELTSQLCGRFLPAAQRSGVRGVGRALWHLGQRSCLLPVLPSCCHLNRISCQLAAQRCIRAGRGREGVVHLGVQLDDWKRTLADPPVIFSCVKMEHKGPHTIALQAKAEEVRRVRAQPWWRHRPTNLGREHRQGKPGLRKFICVDASPEPSHKLTPFALGETEKSVPLSATLKQKKRCDLRG